MKMKKTLIVLLFALMGTWAYSASDILPLHEPSPHERPLIVQQVSQRIYQAAQKQAHYLLSTIHPWKEDEERLLLTESRSGEHWIRPNTNTIAGLAFLYRFGDFDEKVVGMSRERIFHEILLPMIRYITTTHKTGTRPTSDGKKWGDAWQSAHWAHMVGRGCWWMWDELPDDIKQDVRRVIRHEAQRFVGKTPPTQIKRDTKAEENAWNSQILSVAMLLMPHDEQYSTWEKEFQKWALSSYLRPADKNADTLVDGKPVKEQFIGANIYNDYTLENHRIIHPDYMTTFTLTMGCLLDFKMTSRNSPEAIMYNVPEIYENLKWFSLPDGGFVYPNGQDWRLFRNPDWLKAHMYMAMFGHDPDAWTLAMNGLNTMEKMQARSQEGNIYQKQEYFFASTQHDIFYALAQEWLTLQYGGDVIRQPFKRQGVLLLDHGNVILHRTPNAVHTFSWGAEVMAQCVPYQLDRIVSPHSRNGIGMIQLEAQDKNLPVSVHEVSVHNKDDYFEANVQLDHGKSIRAYLHFESHADGTWKMREKLVALEDVKTQSIKTGLIGILNNQNWVYENGKRKLQYVSNGNRNESTIHSRSGELMDLANVTKIVIDNDVIMQSANPLHASYNAAKQPQRARVTDLLFLNDINETKAWKKGKVISEYNVSITCQ